MTYTENLYDCADGADALLLMTEWRQFRLPTWNVIQKVMTDKYIVDGRNIWNRVELEEMGFSFLGAIDMTGLVMVSAGITLANIILPKQKGEAAVALPGCIINICFGTFVEASYPFMFSNKIVFAGALASATVGGSIIGLFNVKGTAYVPAVLAPFMANEGKRLL